MSIDFKKIHIGELIFKKVTEEQISSQRICAFMKCREEELEKTFNSQSIDTENLLRWSKLLEYDFFRLYTQHLILFAPPSIATRKSAAETNTQLPTFRKNIYTKGMIDYVLKLISDGKKTKLEVVERYAIPKTTLYKWIQKYAEKNK